MSGTAQRPLAASLVAAMTLALAACADGPVQPDADAVSGAVTLEGAPAPGLVVTATFDDSGRPPESAVTDADGTYSIAIEPGDDPVQITVSVAPPPDTGCDPPSALVTMDGDFPGEANFSCFSLRVAEVIVVPEGLSLLENRGGTVDFGATPRNDRGTALTTVDVRWELVDPIPGITGGDGGEFVVGAQASAGEHLVRAVAGDVQATAVIHVIRITGDLYYSAGEGGVRQVFLDRLDDPASPQQLFVNPEGNILHLTVDQANGTLYFAQGFGGGSEIMAVPPDGGEPLRFTTNPGLLNQTPSVDPQTGRLFFSRVFGGSQDIYRADPTATALLRITVPGGGGKLWPALSPDGTQLAWSQDRGEGNFEIFTSSSTGANVRRFTAFAGADIAPYWISNDRIAWTRDVTEGNAEILAADWPLGANQEIITLTESRSQRPGNQREPGRSCHQGAVLAISDHEGTADVYILDDGSGDSDLRSWVKVASAEADIASAAMRCR